MTRTSPRLAAVTVYQWRSGPNKPWQFFGYVPDGTSVRELTFIGAVGQAHAWEFRNKSVAELRREGWVR